MPSTLGEWVQELPPDVRPRLAALSVRGQTLDQSAQAYAQEVQQSVNALLGAGAQFEAGWRLLCREVLDGRIAEVQPVREHFLGVFEDRLRLLDEARDLVRFAERVTQRELPEAAQLRDEREALASQLTKLSSRWQTAEDLEDLAAESSAPSAATLEAVRRKHGYPQAWYDDDSKPF